MEVPVTLEGIIVRWSSSRPDYRHKKGRDIAMAPMVTVKQRTKSANECLVFKRNFLFSPLVRTSCNENKCSCYFFQKEASEPFCSLRTSRSKTGSAVPYCTDKLLYRGTHRKGCFILANRPTSPAKPNPSSGLSLGPHAE